MNNLCSQFQFVIGARRLDQVVLSSFGQTRDLPFLLPYCPFSHLRRGPARGSYPRIFINVDQALGRACSTNRDKSNWIGEVRGTKCLGHVKKIE